MLGRLLSAQALSSVGTSISTVALAFMVWRLTGSALQMGAVMAVSTFPLVVTSLLGGAVLDRFSAKRVMIGADLARAVLIFLMPFVAEIRVGLVYLVACLVGVFSAAFNPGQVKLIAELVSQDRLIKANSYLGISRDGAELMGYLAGGALVAAVGYKLAFTIDSGSYLLSAVLLVGLPSPTPPTEPTARVRELLAGSPKVVARLWRDAALRTNLLLAVVPAMFVIMSVPLSWALVLDVFAAGQFMLGVLEACVAAGMIIGGVVISRMSLRQDKNQYVLFSLVTLSACLVVIRFSDYLWLSILLMAITGMVNVGVVIPSMTMYQEAPAHGDKGRLLAIRAGFGQVGTTTGFLLGGALGEALGIRMGFLTAGLAVLVTSLAIYLPYRLGAGRRAAAAAAQETERSVGH